MTALAPLLAVRDLAKAFGGVRAVDGVDFTVAPGELLALIGPNGAGKSTTFNLVNGQLRPEHGSIRLAGEELVGQTPRAIWRRGVGRTFQIAETFGSFTVLQNVQMALLSHQRQIHAWWRRAAQFMPEEARTLLALVGMDAQADRPCAELAYGDTKRVELAIALANRPRLLLMDEPTAGMAPAERSDLMALTKRLARERAIGVLFTEHSMDVVFANADRIVVMAGGQVIAEGAPAVVRANAEVQRAYFGQGHSGT